MPSFTIVSRLLPALLLGVTLATSADAQGTFRASSTGAVRITMSGSAVAAVAFEDEQACSLAIDLGARADGAPAHTIGFVRNVSRCRKGREVVAGRQNGLGPAIAPPGIYRIAAGDNRPDGAWTAGVSVHGAEYVVTSGTLTITSASPTQIAGAFVLDTQHEDAEERITRARFTGSFTALRPVPGH